jgi:hypothetical protein
MEIDEAALVAAAAAEDAARQTAHSKVTKSLPPSLVAKRSEEEETAALHTSQIQAFIRRSRLPPLLSYLDTNQLGPDFRFYPPNSQQNHHASTPLHLAASLNSPTLVKGLLVKARANPEILNGDGKPPFDLAGDRETRDSFRLARTLLGDAANLWNWNEAHVPFPLTQNEADARNLQERQKESQEEEDRRKAEAERLKEEGPKVVDNVVLGKAAGRGRVLALGAAYKSAQEKREEESRGLTPEMRLKLERERRARAAEERFKKMQSGQK